MTDAHEALRELEERARACTACRLAETRTTVVFGDGSADARVMFVGEGPGRNEDLQGVPFVGAAGQLLNRLLEEVDLRREDVYIANVVKCRPPGNRDPKPDEIEACKGYLAGQIQLIDPDVVSTLGNFATKLLLKQEMGITRLRGHAYPWWNRTVVPTFHPAAALRGGESVLSRMREDFLLIEGVLSRTAEVEEEEPEQLGLFG
ncbi:MAG: uracil-DNA glycosylase [Actinobacteria bacterium]|nr:uracil-DNA glycosylase [Actinomycetota bacterium]